MKSMQRLATAILAIAAMSGTGAAIGQEYPAQSIHLIVPYAAGGSTDTVARIWADAVSNVLGQQVIVENYPGAATNIGSEMVADAEPDGYTLLVASFANVVNPTLFDDMPFDARTDFRPITRISEAPNFYVVNPSVPAETLEEFIAYAKEHPGELNYGSGGIGSSAHMTLELLKNRAGLDMVHIPYGGGAPALVDLMNGQVSLSADMPHTLMQYIESGAVRPLAVTSSERYEGLPDLPTAAEAGLPDFAVVAWHGVVAPAGTSDDVANTLYEATVEALQQPEVQERLANLGLSPVASTPADFTDFFMAEIDKWGQVVEENDIRPE